MMLTELTLRREHTSFGQLGLLSITLEKLYLRNLTLSETQPSSYLTNVAPIPYNTNQLCWLN